LRPSSHLLVGAAVGALLGSATGANPLELLIIGSIAGMMPDLDAFTSLLGRRPHRTPVMHSILGSCVITLSWAVLYSLVRLSEPNPFETVPALGSVFVVFLASFLHSALDALTTEGCFLWYPLSSKSLKGHVENSDAHYNLAVVLVSVCVTLFALIVQIHELL